MMLVLCTPLFATDYIRTIVDGESIVEFGDFGKAANQYALTVGDLNVISSDIVTQVNGVTYVEKVTLIDAPDEQLPANKINP